MFSAWRTFFGTGGGVTGSSVTSKSTGTLALSSSRAMRITSSAPYEWPISTRGSASGARRYSRAICRANAAHWSSWYTCARTPLRLICRVRSSTPVENTPMNPRNRYALPARGLFDTGRTRSSAPGFVDAQPDESMASATRGTRTSELRRIRFPAFIAPLTRNISHATHAPNPENPYKTDLAAPAARLCRLAHLHLPGDDPVV